MATDTAIADLSQFQALDLHDTSDFDVAFAEMQPKPRPRFAKWCVNNIVNDQGRPYDYAAYPHIVAPGGPADSIDDHRIRTLTMQFGTRLAKSFTGQCTLLYYADVDPCPMMLASESERSVKKKIMARMYKMVYARENLNAMLLHSSRRDHASDLMQFRNCQIIGAWARSPGTLADETIKVGLANEIDKEGWDGASTSVEGAPHKLFDERFKDFQSVRKVIYESTPTIKGRSRVERRRLISTNCQFYVPCPHCKRYQVLRLAARDDKGEFDWKQPGRVAWETRADGKSDKILAMKTAHYLCESGECPPIINEHRPWMMRRGVWVPEGCSVNHEQALAAAEHWYKDLIGEAKGGDGASLDTPWDGWDKADWVEGSPARDGSDAGYQLSSLYALALTWGDIAAEYIDCEGDPADLKSFIQNWLAETFETSAIEVDWETIGTRIIVNTQPRSSIPEWASLLTIGIDRQKEHYVYVVDAWGEYRTNSTIEYGEFDELDWIQPNLLDRTFPYMDGNGGLKPLFGLIDDSYRPDSDVLEYCVKSKQKGFDLWPSKGSSTALDSDFAVTRLGENTAMPGMILFRVDTIRTQMWLDKALHRIKPGDPGSMTLHAGSLHEHQDFLEQIINDGPVLKMDLSSGNERESWQRLDRNIPNDFRDCKRYSYCGMLIVTRGKPITNRETKTKETRPTARVVNPGIKRPDGRAW